MTDFKALMELIKKANLKYLISMDTAGTCVTVYVANGWVDVCFDTDGKALENVYVTQMEA